MGKEHGTPSSEGPTPPSASDDGRASDAQEGGGEQEGAAGAPPEPAPPWRRRRRANTTKRLRGVWRKLDAATPCALLLAMLAGCSLYYDGGGEAVALDPTVSLRSGGTYLEPWACSLNDRCIARYELPIAIPELPREEFYCEPEPANCFSGAAGRHSLRVMARVSASRLAGVKRNQKAT